MTLPPSPPPGLGQGGLERLAAHPQVARQRGDDGVSRPPLAVEDLVEVLRGDAAGARQGGLVDHGSDELAEVLSCHGGMVAGLEKESRIPGTVLDYLGKGADSGVHQARPRATAKRTRERILYRRQNDDN